MNNGNLKKLLVSHTIFAAARMAIGVFLNVYLWKETGKLNIVIWFNILYLFFHTLSFHGFAYLVKRGNSHLPRKIGLLGFLISGLIIALLRDSIVDYAYLIASVIGIFNGLYWISYHVLRFDLTSMGNRGNYTGLEFGMNIAVGVLMPVLSGAIIAWNYNGFGYPMLFVFGASLFLISFFVGNINVKTHSGSKFHIVKTMKLISKEKDILKSMFAFSFGNISRGGTIANVIMPLFIFDVLKNEFGLGSILSFFSIVAIFFSFGFGKLVDYKHYKNIVLFGGVLYSCLILLLAFKYSFWVLILFGSSIKFFDILLKIPKRVISENQISRIKDFKNHRIEYIVIREWFNIGFGRIAGLLLFLGVSDLVMDQMQVAMVFIAIFTLLDVFTVRSIKADV